MRRALRDGYVLSALGLVALYGGLHLLGLRDWVSVLTATPVEGVSLAAAAIGGSAYVLSWFGAVLVAPVLLLSSALRRLAPVGRRLLARFTREGSSPEGA